ncbi:peptidase S8/S53 domain-containing protein [Nemania serpens]|nr:peptidase S8/S53 domain-containing protein [Nemania serpens]
MKKVVLSLLCVFDAYAAAAILRQKNSIDLNQWNRGFKADASQSLRVSIALAIQNVDVGVETLLRISDPTSPDYAQHLSAQEVARMFEPDPDTVPDVMKWLEDSGIDTGHVELSHGGGHLSLSLSVQAATSLLQTTFYHHTHKETGQEHIICESYHIPESLVTSIDYILAASPVLTHHYSPRGQVVLTSEPTAAAPLPRNCFTQITPACLRNLYGIPTDILPHPNNSFGIFQPSRFSWLPEDLDRFFGALQPNLVNHRPYVDAINGGYLERNRSLDVWFTEANLDFEYAMALTSPQQVTDIQVGSEIQQGNPEDMLAAFDKWYCDPAPEYKKYPMLYPPGCNSTACDCGSSSPPKVLSISYGWTEDGYSPNYLQRQCLEFLKLGLMGTTVVAASGDDGPASLAGTVCLDDTTGNATSGRFSPMYPASCPWLTSVGGTQMVQLTDHSGLSDITLETVLRKPESSERNVSSGSGFSNVFAAPPYQIPHIATYQEFERDHLDEIRDRFNSTGRGYPDVAIRADDYWIVSMGNWKPVSGTSASSPAFASIISLINSERMHAGKGPVGFINPVLYGHPEVLKDVVTGANLGCGVDPAFRATTGWDPASGLGSPDYDRMRRLFMSLP